MNLIKAMAKDLWQVLKKTWIFLLLLVTYCLVMMYFNLQPCLSKLIFGVPCPGCGMTRASLSILMFRIDLACYYNPCVFLLPLILAVIIWKNIGIFKILYKSKIFWGLMFILIITAFVLRMIFMYPNEVLELNQNSLLFLIINLFKK